MNGHSEKVSFIWSVADLLRGSFKQSAYGSIILPLTVLRRLDCVLESTKDAVLKKAESLDEDIDPAMRDQILNRVVGRSFHNLSPFDFKKLKAEPEQISANLNNYINGFSDNIRDIFIDRFDLSAKISKLESANLLFMVISRFSEIDLHPDKVSNLQMGYIFEELIRKFSEQSNETAGEHFTPREVIRLMVNILFAEDADALSQSGVIRELYDPACGTGGMLSVAEDYLRDLNSDAQLAVYGQELNPEAHGICKSDMLIKAQNPENIIFGNSLNDEDGFPTKKFDYMLSNPPFGVDWKQFQKDIQDEHDNQGTAGRYGAGTPRVSDGSLLFVQHMISKFKQDGSTSRIAVVLNGSPLFTGSAGSGESEIRRWIIENDWLEAIVAMPTQLFYNTGIATYVWVITNKKKPERKGKVQLINAVDFYQQMRKSLGDKRRELSPKHIDDITRIFGEFKEGEFSKIFDNEDFGYNRITVERPLQLNFAITEDRIDVVKAQSGFQKLAETKKKREAGKKEIAKGKELQEAILKTLQDNASNQVWKNREDFTKHLKSVIEPLKDDISASLFKTILMGLSERDETANVCMKGKNIEPDSEARDYENIPLKEDIKEYFEREVLPHVPKAWINESKTKVGYEIPFTRHFYVYEPPRPLEDIDKELKELSRDIQTMLQGVIVA